MKRALRSAPKAAVIVAPLFLIFWVSTAAAFGPFDPEGFVVATTKPESYKTSPAQLAPVAAAGMTADGGSYADQGPGIGEGPAQTSIVETTSPTIVPGQPSLVVEIAADRQSASPGDAITYAVEVQNVGTRAASGVVALSHVPAGTSLSDRADCVGSGSGVSQPVCVAASSPGSADTSTTHISHSMSSIPAGGLAIWRFTVVVNLSTAHGTIITNHAHAEAANAALVTSASIEVRVS